MADKFDKAKVGDVLWEVTLNDRRSRILGTGLKYGNRPVRVLDDKFREQGFLVVSWNGNDSRPENYSRREFNKLRLKKWEPKS